MRTRVLIAAAFAGAVLAQVGAADAAVRNFFTPQLDGDRLAFCTQTSEECGKPVADAWCRVNGFDEALLFQREELSAANIAALYPDTGVRCAGDDCVGFRQIKCLRDS